MVQKGVQFSTDRLVVRRFLRSDLDDFHDLESSAIVMKYAGTPPFKSKAENKKRLETCIRAYDNDQQDVLIYAVCKREGSEVIGSCALQKMENGQYEIGYRLRSQHFGHGYGLEVVRGLLKYGFNTLHLTSLSAYVYEDNTHSVRILERTGFVLIKRFFDNKRHLMDREYLLTLADYRIQKYR